MMIRETQTANCPSSATIDFARAFFVANDNARLVNAFATEPSELTPSFRVVTDPGDPKGWREALELRWHHNASFLLPNFHGSLVVRPSFVQSELTLEGRYDWQTASPQRQDTIALAIARAATGFLLRRIVAHVEAEWVKFAGSFPTIAACNVRRIPITVASRG